MTQSASIRTIISASVIASARLSAAAWPPFGALRTQPRACLKRANSARDICAVSSEEPSSDTTTRTRPPYRPAAVSIERSSLAMFSDSLYAGTITSTPGRSLPSSGSFLLVHQSSHSGADSSTNKMLTAYNGTNTCHSEVELPGSARNA
jgi:hypothetical protein